MPAYVLVRSDHLRPEADLARYIREVDATLERFGGTILVQNFPVEVPLGSWDGFVTLLGFRDVEAAREWYHSSDYQSIRPLRTRCSTPTDVIVDGVGGMHRSADLIGMFGLDRG